MPFISKAEREARADKLYRGNSGKKAWILFTIIITGVYIAYVLLLLIGNMNIENANLETPNWLQSIFMITDKDHKFTTAGWVAFGATILVALMLLVSLIIIFLFKSSKEIAKEAVYLVSQPDGGRNNSTQGKSSAKTARERLGIDN